jgi:hypothetical protein
VAVEVFWSTADGSPQETKHERGNNVVIEDGILYVRAALTDGRRETVAGYGPTVWRSYTVTSE